MTCPYIGVSLFTFTSLSVCSVLYTVMFDHYKTVIGVASLTSCWLLMTAPCFVYFLSLLYCILFIAR